MSPLDPRHRTGLHERQLEISQRLLEISQTPAPTFAEGQRATLIARLWAGFGLHPELDAAGNVIARVPGGKRGSPRLCLAAHLDTVFEASTDLSVRRENDRLIGPGVGDNASSLTVLTSYLELIAQDGSAPCELTLVATTGEEGLGDLKGAKHLLSRHHQDFDAFVAVDGYLGLVVDRAVGVRRYRAAFRTEGGHSWGNAGGPSAIHALGEAIHDLYRVPLAQDPRATLNVGTVEGGTSINSIASRAELLLDLRSTDEPTLDMLEGSARAALQRAARRARAELELEKVGDRPAGETRSEALVKAASRALERVGITPRRVASSTDANAAVPYRLPAIAFGVYRGGNAHRLDEWVEPDSLETGIHALEAFVKAFAGG